MKVKFTTLVIGFALFILERTLILATPSGHHTKYVTSSVVSRFSKKSVSESSTEIKVLKITDEICAARIDFIKFKIGKVNKIGRCYDGLFKVHGVFNSDMPPLCGENTGQHIYLDNIYNIPAVITVQTDDPENDDWEFQITQLLCGDKENIPSYGCLQGFKERSGVIQSFNFKKLFFISDPPETYQLAFITYAICLGGQTSNFTSVTFTRPDDATNYYFALNGDIQSISRDVAGSASEAKFDDECHYHPPHHWGEVGVYLEFDDTEGEFLNYTNGPHIQHAKSFCGLGFPNKVRSYQYQPMWPFRLRVKTNFTSTEGSIGFYLHYELH